MCEGNRETEDIDGEKSALKVNHEILCNCGKNKQINKQLYDEQLYKLGCLSEVNFKKDMWNFLVLVNNSK